MSVSELQHYGVKGMKWGVRKDRDASISRRPKSEEHYRKISADLQKQIDLDKTRMSEAKPRKQKAYQEEIDNLEKQKLKADKNAEAAKKGHLTTRDKYLLVGAGVLAAYGTYKLVDSGEMNRLVSKGSNLVNRTEGPNWKKNAFNARKDLDADQIFNSIIPKINPKTGTASENNCRRCTFAYELARRGFDVQATRTSNATGQTKTGLYNALNPGKIHTDLNSQLYLTYKRSLKDKGKFKDLPEFLTKGDSLGITSIPLGVNKLDVKNKGRGKTVSSSIFGKLSSEPNGSRGELTVQWLIGGGHSLAYEIVNNKPVIFDTQLKKMYRTMEDFVELGENISTASTTRLDNVQLNEDFLRRWVKNA